ncbi:CHAT domain-containing protein [Streptomyces niveus]|uniref:CHAT domain-containing protein n=1 Tax=Streptomyces niveus TaxID=193462 RepID=UPI003636658A
MKDPLAALEARLDDFRSTGVETVINDPEAVREAAATLRLANARVLHSGDWSDPVVAVFALYWQRLAAHEHDPACVDEPDVLVSKALLALVYWIAPDSAPAALCEAAQDSGVWTDAANAGVVFVDHAVELAQYDEDHTCDEAFEASILLYAVATGQLDQSSGRFAALLRTLRGLRYLRYQRTCLPADLDEAVRTSRQVLAALPDDDAERHNDLSLHAFTLLLSFGNTGEDAELEEAIDTLRSTIALSVDQTAHRSDLASALLVREARAGDPADLNEAIVHLRTAVDGAADSGRAVETVTLAEALQMQYLRTGDEESLEGAIARYEQATQLLDANDPQRMDVETALASARTVRAALGPYRPQRQRTFRSGFLPRFVRDRLQGEERPVAPTPDYVTLQRQGGGLLREAQRSGSVETTNQAIAVLRRACSVQPAGHPHRAAYLSNVGSALRMRFEYQNRIPDLEQAIWLFQQAVDVGNTQGSVNPGILISLGDAMVTAVRRGAIGGDLDEAVTILRRAMDSPGSEAERSPRRLALGHALRVRYEKRGAAGDLDEATSLLVDAPRYAAEDDPLTARYWSNLALAMILRFRVLGDEDNIDLAVSASQASVEKTPADHPDRAVYLANLGIALRARFDHCREPDDLELAVAALGAAVDGVHNQAHYLETRSLLGVALHTRFQNSHDRADIDKAVAIQQTTAHQMGAVEHEGWGWCAIRLAAALSTRFNAYADESDLRAAGQWWLAAARGDLIPPVERTTAATASARAAVRVGDHETARAAADILVELLPLVAWQGISHQDREIGQVRVTGAASAAAAAAIATGQLERAVAIVEYGRGTLWPQNGSDDEDMDLLRSVDQALAEQLTDVRAALESHGRAFEGAYVPPDPLMATARELDALLTKARRLEGFRDFLTPQLPAFAELRKAASDGPVVIINLSVRCDALVVDRNTVRLIPLQGLTQSGCEKRISTFVTALAAVELSPDASGPEWRSARVTVRETLHWAWTAIAGPVLDALDIVDQPDVPRRLWWCPTGVLTMLPLHAAGDHDADSPPNLSVLDRVVSSYTPTLRALIWARESRSAPDVPRRMLIVSMPTTPGKRRLRNAARETADLIRRFPGSQHTHLTGPDATKAKVLDELPRHAYAHFACHGGELLITEAEPGGALLLHLTPTGGLHLYDGKLSVADITHQTLPHMQLAVLSACKTAFGSLELLDEAIHPATALQHAGCRHVIASLWSVSEHATPEFVGRVYDTLNAADGELDVADTAVAVHRATLHMRHTYGAEPLVWTPYVHIGP